MKVTVASPRPSSNKPLQTQSISKHCLRTYRNSTNRIQIVRFVCAAQPAWERTLSPEQTIVFEADDADVLEVSDFAIATAIRSDTIRCNQL